jgi:hypothetical protein
MVINAMELTLLCYNGRRGGWEQIGKATHEGRNLGFGVPDQSLLKQ